MKDFPRLPLWHALPEIRRAFSGGKCAVIEAEPGAGKTMLVPVLARECCTDLPGSTVLIAPRRIAVRAAAGGIAALHGFTMGKEIGFALRGESCRCQKDGILCVTPGIFLQMLQQNPMLEGISAVIFDEFHERQMEVDLALTLTLDIRESLRDDLLLAVMSATIAGEEAGNFLSAPVIKVPGRGFPVEIFYRESSNHPADISRECARAVVENVSQSTGNILVFLPGIEDIRRCRGMLEDFAGKEFALRELHGSLPIEQQRSAIAPEVDGRRKIILATNVAESSLTVDQVDLVIDSGWEKRAVWSPGAQMNFLELRRITRDSAIQRAGRAGRTAPGKAVRCFSEFTFNTLPQHLQPEILRTDLTTLLLTVGCWGSEINSLRWLDAPPEPAVAGAAKVLRELGLFTAENRPAEAGKQAALLPVSPRMAAMMIHAPASMRKSAALLAAVLEEKDDFHRYGTADLKCRIKAVYADRIRRNIAERLLREFPPAEEESNGDAGLLIASAFPEWICRRRESSGTVYQFAGGGAGVLKDDDPLQQEEFLAVARLDGGSGGNSAIRLALPVEGKSLEKLFACRIEERCITQASPEGKLNAWMVRGIGEMVLSRRSCAVPPGMAVPALIKEALRRHIALPPVEDKRAAALLARMDFSRKHGMDELPETGEEFLLAAAGGFPDNISSFAELKKADWYNILRGMLDYQLISELDRLAPEFFTAPTGTKFAIDYSGEQPLLSIPLQHLYGVTIHPVLGRKALPLRIELLSPARRPVQITCDLPGFWNGSWELVRKEMRSRYPKHDWPEDPAAADPRRSSVKNHKKN